MRVITSPAWFCAFRRLGIPSPVLENGLVRPETSLGLKDSKKVIIHPTSSSYFKNWNLRNFIRLEELLQENGFSPEFILDPKEKNVAARLKKAGMKCFMDSDISSVALYLTTASRFIGNDSGIGFLASNVGLPTHTLFALPRKAMRWLPCWSPAVAILPSLSEIIPELIRSVIWKYWISPEKVLAIFKGENSRVEV